MREKGGLVTDIESEKVNVPAPAAAKAKRSKTVGTLAVVAGVLAAVVGLVNVLGNNRDIVDILLVIGGLLVSLAGLRIMRKARAS
jgi:lipid-A-disaccharide synthase-like uncharacterized protein